MEVLPLAEIEFRDPPGPRGERLRPIVSLGCKWDVNSFDSQNSQRVVPGREERLARTRGGIRAAARRSWDAMKCSDYTHADMRVDAHDRPVVLEVNPNPGISLEAGFTAALAPPACPIRTSSRSSSSTPSGARTRCLRSTRTPARPEYVRTRSHAAAVLTPHASPPPPSSSAPPPPTPSWRRPPRARPIRRSPASRSGPRPRRPPPRH